MADSVAATNEGVPTSTKADDTTVSAFGQQRLRKLFINLRAPALVAAFLTVGIVFFIVGAFIVVSFDAVTITTVSYSEVNKYQYIPSDPSININQGIRTFSNGTSSYTQGSRARVAFTLAKTMLAPVYFYYRVTGMFQDYRYFHDGRSCYQLAGGTPDTSLLYQCQPFLTPGTLDGTTGRTMTINGGTTTVTYGDFMYYPCGVAPWAMFNDSLLLYRVDDPATFVMPASTLTALSAVTLICNGSDFNAVGDDLGYSNDTCAKQGISMPADVNVRYRGVVKGSLTWSIGYEEQSSDWYLSNGWYANEPGHALPDPLDLDLQVWLRIAPVAEFNKLYRIINADLPAGEYVLEVDEFYDVYSFDGGKAAVLMTSSWLGAKNYAIGVAYLLCGSLCTVLATAVFVIAVTTRGSSWPKPRNRWYIFESDSPSMRSYVDLRERRSRMFRDGVYED